MKTEYVTGIVIYSSVLNEARDVFGPITRKTKEL